MVPITTIKYSCQVQMLPEPSNMTPNMAILHDSFTKASLLQLFTCPGKVSCEGRSTGLQATKKRESYASIEPHKNDELEHLDIFCDVQDFSVTVHKFISLEPTSYHVRCFEDQIESMKSSSMKSVCPSSEPPSSTARGRKHRAVHRPLHISCRKL